MKNSVLKYDKEKLDLEGLGSVNVSDYHSLNIRTYEFLDDLADMLEPYQVLDNDRIERISYELYGTTNHWDLLLLINKLDPLFDMAYEEGLIINNMTTAVNIYANVIYSHAPLVPHTADSMVTELITNAISENEKLRVIKVIKPSRINDAIRILKTKGYV